MSFLLRRLETTQTIGSLLKHLRKSANRTLLEMSQATKIQQKHLKALEADAWGSLPEPVYTRQLLRMYATALGGDANYVLSRFEKERGTCDILTPVRLPRKKIRLAGLFSPHRLFASFGVLLLFLGAGVYMTSAISAMRRAPTLEVMSPEEGFVSNAASVRVSGKTEPETHVRINGQTVLSTQDGSFDTSVVLERGVNMITIEARRRHSKPTQVWRRVLLHLPEHASRPLSPQIP